VPRHGELRLFDRAFVAWFLRGPVAPLVRQKQTRRFADRVVRDTLESGSDEDEADESSTPHELGASGHELIREKDFAEMTPEEFERVRRLMAAIARTRPRRMSRRRSADPRGDVLDMRFFCRHRCGRAASRSNGRGSTEERSPEARRRDISGSMDAYARALLFHLRRSSGTGRGGRSRWRLPRLAPDWRRATGSCARSGKRARSTGSGTHPARPEVRAVYGRRALSRGAVVVIVSDGWARRSRPRRAQMAKLARAAVVWVNR
jgi:uncharacterized protein with von Willebrand factor type A (vWA) domain